MKHLLLSASVAVLSFCGFAQTQIGNGDMESWGDATSDPADGTEPTNWNSFMTAQGGLSGFADIQVDESNDTRPGSSGSSSARIWSRDAGFGVTANGNLTLGKINMGSIQASSPDNYNFSEIANPDHSEAITDSPDSIVFWANYTANDPQQEARMKATLHDNYEYRDPEDAAASDHVVATAELNYSPTNGWTRFAVAFDYSGPASTVEYILITFASNAIPGGGDPNDQVLIDDVELIYNSNSIEENAAFPVNVFMNNEIGELNFETTGFETGVYEVYDMSGAKVLSGDIAPKVAFNAPAGVYLIHVLVGNETKRFKVYNH